jgi:hypothetical protein
VLLIIYPRAPLQIDATNKLIQLEGVSWLVTQGILLQSFILFVLPPLFYSFAHHSCIRLDTEADADIQMFHAIAPGARKILVTSLDSWDDIGQAIHWAALNAGEKDREI